MSVFDKNSRLIQILSQFRPTLIHDPPPFIPTYYRIIYGTFSSMVATTLVHPFDFLKTRLQISPFPYTSNQMARRIMLFEGFGAFYYGINAALYRQLFHTGLRLTCYNYLYEQFTAYHKRRPSIREKVNLGVIAGIAGAIVGNPSEVVLVRMMASSAPRAYNRCPDLQGLINKRYKSFPDACLRIIKEEGVTALWRGGLLTTIRSVMNTVSQIGAYAYFRDTFRKNGTPEGYRLHVFSAMCSSMVFILISLPFDIVKTRYQMRRKGITKMQIFNNIVKVNGLLYFWKKPLIPYYFRVTLHTLTSFFVNEAIENCYDEEERKWLQSLRR